MLSTSVRNLLVFWVLTLTFPSYALDSSLTTLNVSTYSPGSANGSCSMYFIDAYAGTVLPVTSPPRLSGTAITLNFYNNGTASITSPPVSCAGTYKMMFTVEVKAETNVASVTITPSVTTGSGTAVFPGSAGPSTFTIYPQCNNTNLTNPYCTMNEISGSAFVTLAPGDTINAPILVSSDTITVTGGQFVLYSCPAGATTC